MTLIPFLENLAGVLLVAPLGAGVLGAMGFIVMPWRKALQSWWYMTVLFVMIGGAAALPTLLTGQRFIGSSGECSSAVFGISC